MHLDYGTDGKPDAAQILMTGSDFDDDVVTGAVTRDTVTGNIVDFGWPTENSNQGGRLFRLFLFMSKVGRG